MKEYFKNDKHIFEATINKGIYGDTIKIGGKSYNNCINISIDKDNSTKAIISHLQSEPECSFDKIIEEKDTSNFIKASLQYISYKYPKIKTFKFDDMSHIDCGKSKNIKPPRKQEKPFSLAHLYLATHGETWYENRFKAKMINTDAMKNYKESRNHLHKKIDIDYDKFKHLYSIDENNDAILSKYYSKDKTWIELFTSIPKDDRCIALYNWLPSFINERIKHTFNPFGWYIDIETMPKTTMEITDKPEIKGGAKTRKAKNNIKFTNKQYFESNGHIFDGNV